jgi:hypothetical protein
MDGSDKQEHLPLRISDCSNRDASVYRVISVNEKPIEAIDIEMKESNVEGDCKVGLGVVSIKEIGKHFARGINRFEVESGEFRSEVILDIEL